MMAPLSRCPLRERLDGGPSSSDEEGGPLLSERSSLGGLSSRGGPLGGPREPSDMEEGLSSRGGPRGGPLGLSDMPPPPPPLEREGGGPLDVRPMDMVEKVKRGCTIQ